MNNLLPGTPAGRSACTQPKIDIDSLTGLRDRAKIGVTIYTFAHVGAVLQKNVRDYFSQGGAVRCGCREGQGR